MDSCVVPTPPVGRAIFGKRQQQALQLPDEANQQPPASFLPRCFFFHGENSKGLPSYENLGMFDSGPNSGTGHLGLGHLMGCVAQFFATLLRLDTKLSGKNGKEMFLLACLVIQPNFC